MAMKIRIEGLLGQGFRVFVYMGVSGPSLPIPIESTDS